MRELKKEEVSSVNGGFNIPNLTFPPQPIFPDNSWVWESILENYGSRGHKIPGSQGMS
ncbi:hypothetical protein ABW636_08255 [Aquimarina sp. 2201CG1-2-11]|uniref:hypothetical protein n=1 Tax=Aquimarina discodermiae TaxID=3231043 RepID=UPI0034632B55